MNSQRTSALQLVTTDFSPSNLQEIKQLEPLEAPQTSQTSPEVNPRISQVVLNTSELIAAQVKNTISNKYLAYNIEDGSYKEFVSNSHTRKYDPLVAHLQSQAIVHYKAIPFPEEIADFYRRAGIEKCITETMHKIFKVTFQDGSSLELAGEDKNGQPIIVVGQKSV
ncbi:MAG: hypothetical protein ACRCZE_04630 [Candidatus Altimarinota bacterium]